MVQSNNAKSKTSTSKKSNASSSSTAMPSETAKGKDNTNVILISILILVVFQLIVLFGLLISESDSIDSNMSDLESKITSIEDKVSAIDGFFAANVEGYGGNAPSGNTQTGSIDPSQIDIEGEPTKGNPDATVTIVEFSDYECPFCGRFYSQSYGQLVEEYIDTGKVKLVFKDFPLGFHQLAKPSSIAANCVLNQLGDEKYFEYHNTLFENQQTLSVDNLNKWAEELGVDTTEFETCINDPKVAQEVDEDLIEGTQLGVEGTPSFFINGNLIVGAQPYSVIKAAIEAELE